VKKRVEGKVFKRKKKNGRSKEKNKDKIAENELIIFILKKPEDAKVETFTGSEL